MIYSHPSAAVLLFALLCAAPGQSSLLSKQGATDPEASSAGRESYLGREIAKTMYWTGAEWLLRESREDEEQCNKLLLSLGELDGKTVCDFGCGNGFYTLQLAERVGETGRILAVDLQSEMLELLKERVRQTPLTNISTVQASLTDTGLAPGSCDGILLVDVYHEISHPVTVLEGLRKALKPDGKVYLVEYRLEDEAVPIKLKHKMSKTQMLLEMQANGLRFAKEFDGLPWQHVMAFERDPDFDPEKNQDLASGTAIARGLRRALLARDSLSLKGFYGEQVLLAEGSSLLKSPTEEQGVRLSRNQWHARLVSFMDSFTEEHWRTEVSSMKLVVRVPSQQASGTNRIHLTSSGEGQSARWVLTKSDRGQWLVSEERLTL